MEFEFTDTIRYDLYNGSGRSNLAIWEKRVYGDTKGRYEKREKRAGHSGAIAAIIFRRQRRDSRISFLQQFLSHSFRAFCTI